MEGLRLFLIGCVPLFTLCIGFFLGWNRCQTHERWKRHRELEARQECLRLEQSGHTDET